MRCVAQNASVTVVMAANFSAMAFGILSDIMRAGRGLRTIFLHIIVPKPSYRRRRYCWGTKRSESEPFLGLDRSWPSNPAIARDDAEDRILAQPESVADFPIRLAFSDEF